MCYATRRLSPFVIATEPGALDPVEANFGFRPASIELVTPVNPQLEMIQLLAGPARQAVAAGARVLIWDSMTSFCVRLFSHLMAVHKDGRRVYSLMRPMVADLVTSFLSIPALVHVAIAHEELPHDGEYGMARGGPKLEDRRLTEAIPGLFRLVLRATASGTKRTYECDGMNPLWVMGDGYGSAFPSQPMDLRPILWRVLNPAIPVPQEAYALKPYRVPTAVE